MRTSYKKSTSTQGYDRRSGSVYALIYHLVLVTRYRTKVLTSERRRYAAAVAARLLEQADGRLLECNGEADHLHLLMTLAPSRTPATIVNALKSATSRQLRTRWPSLKRRRSLWSPSYFISTCGGASLETVKKYIQEQQSS